jgi:hypothetical protein
MDRWQVISRQLCDDPQGQKGGPTSANCWGCGFLSCKARICVRGLNYLDLQSRTRLTSTVEIWIPDLRGARRKAFSACDR